MLMDEQGRVLGMCKTEHPYMVREPHPESDTCVDWEPMPESSEAE